METKNYPIGFIVILAIITIAAALFIGFFVGSNRAQAPVPTPQPNPNITVANLNSGQAITLPYTVSGEVKGWFFEGSFPVFLKDANGNQLGYGLASSSQDWMTANPIPFTVTLPTINYQGPGTVVFTKDNPSGEPQFDDSYTVSVIFQ